LFGFSAIYFQLIGKAFLKGCVDDKTELLAIGGSPVFNAVLVIEFR
jgi:hypothetical protein